MVKKWRIKVNQTKSIHVTFTTRKETFSRITLNGLRIPQAEDAKYLGLHLDRRLEKVCRSPSENNLDFNWTKWLLGSKSLSTENKLLLYKAILSYMASNCWARSPIQI